MLNKKQNLKSGKKQRYGKGICKKKEERKPTKNEKGLMKKNFLIEYFDVVLFKKQKHRRKKKEKRDQNKKQKGSKQERQEGRKKEKKNRETEKEKVKKGEAKKG